MKLKKAEIWVLFATLLFLAMSIGYQAGRSRTPAEFSVRTSAAEPVRNPDPAEPDRQSAAVLTPAEPININTAGAEELCTLNGIGEALAGRIIAYREEQGAFSCIEDITKVSGIGSSTFERLRDWITVD